MPAMQDIEDAIGEDGFSTVGPEIGNDFGELVEGTCTTQLMTLRRREFGSQGID